MLLLLTSPARWSRPRTARGAWPRASSLLVRQVAAPVRARRRRRWPGDDRRRGHGRGHRAEQVSQGAKGGYRPVLDWARGIGDRSEDQRVPRRGYENRSWPRCLRQAAVAPVWFIVEDGVLVFNTNKETAKGRALARRSPGRALRGPGGAAVRLRPGAGRRRVVRRSRRAGAHRHGDRRPLHGPGTGAGEYGKRNGVPGELVVRLHPTKVIAHFDVSG